MARGIKTPFNPQYPEKYNGTYPIVSKSTWELEFMRYCDQHPDVLQWAYEPHDIPYQSPLKEGRNKQSIYKPDFLVTMINKSRQTVTKLIEVKPLHEANQGFAKNTMDSVIKMNNDAKWAAAQAWAMRRGIEFMIMTEAEMFLGHENRSPRQNPIRPAVPGQVKNLKPQTSKKPGISKLAKGFKSNKARTGSKLSKSTVGKIRKSPRAGKVKKI